jgi:lysyl-tRNA synthetase class 2
VLAEPQARATWAPRLTAALLIIVGLLDVVIAARPRIALRWEFISDVMPAFVVSWSAGASVTVGVLLIALARGVWRGKRRAWRVTVVLVVVQLTTQVLQRHLVLVVGSLLLLVLLLTSRHQFRGRSDPSTRRTAAFTALALLGVSLLVGSAAVAGLARQQHVTLGPAGVLLAVAQGLVGIPSVVTAPESRQSDAVYYLLLSMAATTLAVTGFLALRSARTPRHSSADERALRSLLASDHGQDSLGYFATRDDRVVCWSRNGRACISYKVVAGTALAGGDPIGPPAEWPGAIRTFLETAADEAWVPAVAAASAAAARTWSDVAGFSALEFGDEAVLAGDSFTLAGRAMRSVRQAVARAARAGNVVTITRLGDGSAGADAALRDLASTWRGHEAERGFSMGLGRIDAARDPDSIVVAASRLGELQALLVFVPWGDDGVSLDVMRRSPTATNGTTELMISTLMGELESRGLRRVSLNFVVFRDTIERAEEPDAARIPRAWGQTVRGITGWSQVESLYRFTSKFQPEWHPRYLLYPSAASLPRIAWAYLDAESFAPRPWTRLPQVALPRRPAARTAGSIADR